MFRFSISVGTIALLIGLFAAINAWFPSMSASVTVENPSDERVVLWVHSLDRGFIAQHSLSPQGRQRIAFAADSRDELTSDTWIFLAVAGDHQSQVIVLEGQALIETSTISLEIAQSDR